MGPPRDSQLQGNWHRTETCKALQIKQQSMCRGNLLRVCLLERQQTSSTKWGAEGLFILWEIPRFTFL